MRRVRQALTGLSTLTVVLGLAAPAVADPGSGRTSTQVTAEAERTAETVVVLAREADRRAGDARQAAGELAAAFADLARADEELRAVDGRLRAARSRRSASVRALYVEGESGMAAAVLTAGSVKDALWRLSVGRRVGGNVVRETVESTQRIDDQSRRVADRVRNTEEATTRMARAARRLSEEASSSQVLLDQARRRLDTLTGEARRLRAAEQAAAALAAAQRSASSIGAVGSVTALGIPTAYEHAYRAAEGQCPGLRWTLLAALGQVESGHGRNNGPSSAGAIGPMQFMPATFASYGVDGDGDGRADAWNPADAIPSAAGYLCASGLDDTDAGVRAALLAYNHAEWYVELVLTTERAISARAASQP